jgi:hypothetical protein
MKLIWSFVGLVFAIVEVDKVMRTVGVVGMIRSQF